jgi:tRNA (guanine-N7-)-methyltransferase
MKRKQERFRIVEERSNVIEPTKELYNTIRGNWKQHFNNENPITIELACGRGEYTVGLAALFPERNYIGIDVKGERIWKGSTIAVEKGLTNAAFLRTPILNIEFFFAQSEVDEIWITFPDPRPKKRDIKRRLTNSRFLNMYKKVLKKDGFVRFKTDNTDLFNYTLEELGLRSDITDFEFTHSVYKSDLRPECFDIKTKYEEVFANKGETIKYLRFRFS